MRQSYNPEPQKHDIIEQYNGMQMNLNSLQFDRQKMTNELNLLMEQASSMRQRLIECERDVALKKSALVHLNSQRELMSKTDSELEVSLLDCMEYPFHCVFICRPD